MKSPLERKPNSDPKPALSLPFPLHSLAGAAQAGIRDGDFRTYVLLCQLAWQEQGEKEAPYTECSLARLAALHPGGLSPETVRGRLQRLVKAGLVVRKRVGRTTWRTYLLLESDPDRVPRAHPGGVTASPAPGEFWQLGHRPEEGDPDRVLRAQPGGVTASPGPGELTPPGHRAQERASERVPNARPHAVTASREPGQAAGPPRDRAPDARPCTVTGPPEPAQAGFAPPDRAASPRPATVPAPRARPRASDRTDPDRNEGWDAPAPWKGALAEDDPLVLALTQLRPEPMNWEGIQECAIEPELAWAWYRYVQERGTQVLNSAAYIRHGVRSGRFPPGHRRRIPVTRYPLGMGRHPYLTSPTLEERSHGSHATGAPVAGVPRGSAGWPLDVG